MARCFLAAVVMLLGGMPAWGHDYKSGDIVINHPWARPSLRGSPNGVAYMTLTNTGEVPDRLLEVNAGVAQRAELHTTIMDDNVMRMRPIADGIEIAPGETVEIAPGGPHVMLMGLAAPLKEGDRFPMELRFESAGTVEVSIHVEVGQTPKPQETHDHNH